MKKVLTISITALLLLIICAVGGGYWLLQSSYLTNITNYLLQQYRIPVSVAQAEYDFPTHLTFKGIETDKLQQTPLYIERAEIWFNSNTIAKRRPVIDSILLNGVDLQHGIPDLPKLSGIELHQLAITNLNYAAADLVVRESSIQIKNPQFINPEQVIPFGTIQFSAEQIERKQETFDEILIDIDYKEHNSTLYGASFRWRDADISGQAEQYEQGWSLVNVTIDKLYLADEEWQNVTSNEWSLLGPAIYHINSLDILNSTLNTADFQISNGNLSLENITLGQDGWHQDKGYISFNADSFTYKHHRFIEPAFKSDLSNKLITVNDLHFEFEQGLIQTTIELAPDSLYLKQLNIDGVKWIYESDKDFSFINHYLSQLKHFAIDHLKIRRSQFIQLATQPNWQLSGLSVDGKDLLITREAQLGLWQGSLVISANNASYNQLLSSQPLISMTSDNNVWVGEAFVPLENGLITATTDFHFSQPSQPWRIEASIDGLPVELFTSHLTLPIELEAIAELQMSLSGLGGDRLMLNHSLSGQVAGSLRDSVLLQGKESVPFESSDFSLTADRGRITIEPVIIETKRKVEPEKEIKIKREPETEREDRASHLDDTLSRTNNEELLPGYFYGSVDLLKQERSEIILKLNSGCFEHTFDLFNRSEKVERFCDESSLNHSKPYHSKPW